VRGLPAIAAESPVTDVEVMVVSDSATDQAVSKAKAYTASGMRVVRRSSLSSLFPLPDGLHFTPAMSVRALLGRLTIAEVDMTYREREGESKLHVLKAGIRLLRAIMHAAFLYRPSRPLALLAAALLAQACVMMIYPVMFFR
jgi:hypothetical protein